MKWNQWINRAIFIVRIVMANALMIWKVSNHTTPHAIGHLRFHVVAETSSRMTHPTKHISTKNTRRRSSNHPFFFTPFEIYPLNYCRVSGDLGIGPLESVARNGELHNDVLEEGLVDTKLEISETGYSERRELKEIKGILVKYDAPVRNALRDVIQFVYGDYGTDAVWIESQDLETQKNKKSVLVYSDVHVMEMVDKLQERLKIVPRDGLIGIEAQKRAILLFNILFRGTLASKRVLHGYKPIWDAFQLDISEIGSRILLPLVAPGEFVVGIAAELFGQLATQMTLDAFHSDSVNILAVMYQADVSSTWMSSNHLIEIVEGLGTKAIHLSLLDEFWGVVSFDRVYVNYRHLAIWCDTERSGCYWMAITHRGTNPNDTGTLLMGSFEETFDILLDAGAQAETDYSKGITENTKLAFSPTSSGYICGNFLVKLASICF